MHPPIKKMEENTFMDYNPQFSREYNLPSGNDPYMGARNSGIEDGALKRWLNPGLAEAAQFDRENYFMDKENAFNEYMYNKANEYNSPEAQMERAKEAGINPQIAAAGIMGTGNATAVPMQGARGDTGMNQNAINPIEQLGNVIGAIQGGVGSAEQLGNMLGFGKKNKAEIKNIETLTNKAAKELEYTQQQTKQLRKIGNILVENARTEGEQMKQNIENLKKLYEVYDQQKWNTAADTNLKVAQTGTEIENQKSIWYDNMRKEFEKNFRDIFGIELTHDKIAMLCEAIMGGKGKTIINWIEDTVAEAIRTAKKGFEENIIEILNPLSGDTTEKIKNGINKVTNKIGKGVTKVKNKANQTKEGMKDWIKNMKSIWEKLPGYAKKKYKNFEDYLEKHMK